MFFYQIFKKIDKKTLQTFRQSYFPIFVIANFGHFLIKNLLFLKIFLKFFIIFHQKITSKKIFSKKSSFF